MRQRSTLRLCLAGSLLLTAVVGGASAAPSKNEWNAAGAAQFLDQRLTWWRAWPKAERDHGTHCISCHTALPIALARPILRQSLGQAAPTSAEQAMYADITKRVAMWREVDTFYTDQRNGLPKSSEARAVEAVLNALFLVARDNAAGRQMAGDTRQAFANMWPLQMQTGDLKGGFAWLTFKLEPWESESATYWGAALAAVAVADAPEGYARTPEIAKNVDALRAYLRTGLGGNHSLFTHMLVLWADARLHGILEPAQRQAILYQLLAVQSTDGGWSLARLSTWQRIDGTVIPDVSDGFATAIVTLALKDSGVPVTDAPIKAARAWMIGHQDPKTGALPATSINKLRDPSADAYLFMTDAATGFATLALTDAKPSH